MGVTKILDVFEQSEPFGKVQEECHGLVDCDNVAAWSGGVGVYDLGEAYEFLGE